MHNLQILWFSLSLHVLIGQCFSLSFGNENPTTFSPVEVSWTRDDSDPVGWWLDEVTTNGDKILSMQVNNNARSNGSIQFVFVQPGLINLIASSSSDDKGFFTSTPVTVSAADSASCATSCPTCSSSSVSSIVDSSSCPTATPCSQSSSASSNTPVIVGATLGALIFGSLASACIILFCRHRHSHPTPMQDQPAESSATSRSSSRFFGNLGNSNLVTPFILSTTSHAGHGNVAKSSQLPPNQPLYDNSVSQNRVQSVDISERVGDEPPSYMTLVK
ncbi:hypothetical protein K435DRAFT_862314 [Dendrothele bispora CBS 962.96]|uniref:Mid2 domain-containing protein n=1 Tax=Dendrothele bispora (strain CBS 962.96) TaxID=1314807 RepID=A0A4S8LTB3_DENBC|nr:hypothetical protein K435DRAFT_862314 [Dendrothele bispora CBS 962.96]